MSLLDRIRGVHTNGEAITSPNTEGLEPMNETTTENLDRGMPPIDLTNLETAEVTDHEVVPTVTMDDVEKAFARVLAAEDRRQTTRSAARRTEPRIVVLQRAVDIATAAARQATVDRIIAEQSAPEGIDGARHLESESILELSKAKTDLARAEQEGQALGERLKVDESVDVALGAAREAVDALVTHETEVLTARIGCELSFTASKLAIEAAQLLAILGNRRVWVGPVAIDAELIRKLIAWAGVTNPQPNAATRRLLDVSHYARREAAHVSDPELRVRGLNVAYEAEREGTGIPLKWMPGQPLVLRNRRPAAVGLRFEGRDELVEIQAGETRDLTSFGIPNIPSREYIDQGVLELVSAA